MRFLTDQRGPNVDRMEKVLQLDGSYLVYLWINIVDPIEYIPFKIVLTKTGIEFEAILEDVA
jgi:hypothetical protein